MWIVRLLLMFICCFRHNRETFSFSLFSASTRAYSLFLLFLMHMGISPSIFIDSENIVASFLLFDNALCTSSMVLILSKISVQRAFIECQKVLVAQQENERVSVWWKYLRMNPWRTGLENPFTSFKWMFIDSMHVLRYNSLFRVIFSWMCFSVAQVCSFC